MHDFVPDATSWREPARELPFRDGWFDLVFTVGVLVVVPEETIRTAMCEMARVSSRYVLSGEMFAPEMTSIPHREIDAALFKRDYGKVFVDAVTGLT